MRSTPRGMQAAPSVGARGSRQGGPRKAVKPSSSSFSGRMLLLAEQVPEEGQRLRRRLVAAAQLAGVELGEQLDGAQALPPLCGRGRPPPPAGARRGRRPRATPPP